MISREDTINTKTERQSLLVMRFNHPQILPEYVEPHFYLLSSLVPLSIPFCDSINTHKYFKNIKPIKNQIELVKT